MNIVIIVFALLAASTAGINAAKHGNPMRPLNASASPRINLSGQPDHINTSLPDPYKLLTEGNKALHSGNVAQAEADFTESLQVQPDLDQSFYGLGDCAWSLGDLNAAAAYYAKVIYEIKPGNPGYGTPGTIMETNVTKLMKYAQILNQIGKAQEAITIYDHSLKYLNYESGLGSFRRFPVLVPEFGEAPAQLSYSQTEMEAMTELAMGVVADGGDGDGTQDEGTDIESAYTLDPNSPVINYYLGRYYYSRDKNGMATPYLQFAAQYGDPETVKQANSILALMIRVTITMLPPK